MQLTAKDVGDGRRSSMHPHPQTLIPQNILIMCDNDD